MLEVSKKSDNTGTAVKECGYTEFKMQLSVKKARSAAVGQVMSAPLRLAELQEGQEAILDRLELPEDIARRLMELGFLPGCSVRASRCAPGGDPRVFQVDGSEIALRRETAQHLHLRK